MTRAERLLIAALACASVAGSAQALSFSPAPTSFTASGVLYLTGQQASTKCEVSLKGKVTKKGVVNINSLSFKGSSQCTGTAATALPWKALASGPTLGKILNFGFAGSFFGTCGPGSVPFTDNSSGVWTLAGSIPGGCSVNGTLSTSPAIVIVP